MAGEPVTPDEFRDARIALHLSQIRTAHLLGVSQATVRNWETGTHRIPRMAAIIMTNWLAQGEPALS